MIPNGIIMDIILALKLCKQHSSLPPGLQHVLVGDERGQRRVHVHGAAAPPVLRVLKDLQVLLGVGLGGGFPASWRGGKDDITDASMYKEITTVTESNE